MKIQRHIQCFTTENYPKDTETEYRLKIIMGALRISNIRLTYKNIPLVGYIFKNLCKDMDNFEIKLNDSISVNGMNNYDTYLIKLGYKQHISKYSIDCNNFVYVFSDEELNKDYLKDIVSEKEGIKLCISFMKEILDVQVDSNKVQDIKIISQVYIQKV